MNSAVYDLVHLEDRTMGLGMHPYLTRWEWQLYYLPLRFQEKYVFRSVKQLSPVSNCAVCDQHTAYLSFFSPKIITLKVNDMIEGSPQLGIKLL